MLLMISRYNISIINIHKPYVAELQTKLANDLGPYISGGMTPDIFSFGHASWTEHVSPFSRARNPILDD